jgi:hypothetical protein
MARSSSSRSGADRCGARPVPWAAGTARAPTPPWPEGPKSGKRRPRRATSPGRPRLVTGRSCAASGVSVTSRGAYPRAAASRARRAPRALEDVRKVLTDRGSQRCGSQRITADHSGSQRIMQTGFVPGDG